MVKLIDIILPIAPLPKDKKERKAVIDGYEYSVEKHVDDRVSGILWALPFFLIGIYSVSNGFSTFNASIWVCISLSILIYLISIIALIYCKLIQNKASTYAKISMYFFLSLTISVSQINMFFGYLYLNRWFGKNVIIDINTYVIVYSISIVAYYIGYWYFLLRFNRRMQEQDGSILKKSLGATGGLVGYYLASHVSFYLCAIIAFLCFLYISSYLSCSLVNYRQYDNIQRAKKGMTFK